ncbi:MAG TPA: hypothetical protein VGL37_09905 [Solirubrobacteraceae bacterium]|jgi:hypothetical protein
MLANFSGSVTLSGGRTFDVHPLRQIVRPILACVTCGFNVPGVQRGSGREYSPEPIVWHDPAGGCGCNTLSAAVE